MKRRTFLMLLLVACTRSDQALDPVWGKEPCESCGMIVGDRQTAAQIITADGERKYFDDPGCMVMWLSKHPPAARSWVRNASANEWLDAKSAKWVSAQRTPMDYGWTANDKSGESFDAMQSSIMTRRQP
jgi:hypothetical protein